MAQGVRRSIEKGTTLHAGDSKLRVREAVTRGARVIAVDSAATNPPTEKLPFFYFEYDYTDLAHTTKVPGDLSNGSLLMWVASPRSDGRIQIDQETKSGSTLVSQWTAALPGHTLSFNGADECAQLADNSAANLKKCAAAGDVSLEAWVRPREMADEARILQHGSADSSYTLGLKRQPLRSALQLDGTNDSIQLSNKDHLNFAGVITIEAWIMPIVPGGVHGSMNIVAHGYVSSPANEVFLRITGDTEDTRYQIGSWNGSTHLARFSVPSADKTGNTWVHLAGVYDGSAWRLYHNGELKAIQSDDTDALQVNADWATGGRGGTKERLFRGQIDDVRIWKRARTVEEINADMLRRLSGNETDLAGYWHFEDRAAQDYSRYQNHGTV
jgi:Concanavalin A-like lectin/glucanases superfamily